MIRDRIALEAYPGLLARSVLGKASYKADDKARQTQRATDCAQDADRGAGDWACALAAAAGLRLKLSHAQRDRLADDASGDSLDAVLCLVQAAWALQQHQAGHASVGPARL